METQYNLERYVEAQNSSGYAGYETAVKELAKGKKLSHWVWYVFPKLKNIGQSSQYDDKYGIRDFGEAIAYMKVPVLRDRYNEVCNILLNLNGIPANSIFGMADASRVRSSITLFYLVTKEPLLFRLLETYFNGIPCQDTLYALKMTMPKREPVNVIYDNKFEQTKTIKHKGEKLEINKTTSHKGHKLIVAICFVLGIICGCICYFLLDHPINESTDNANFTTQVRNVELKVSVNIVTSDNYKITYEDLNKYDICVGATFNNEKIKMDTLSNSFVFRYNEKNIASNISIDISVGDCNLQKIDYTYNDFKSNKNEYNTRVTLPVSQMDLRIYEELKWYETVKRRISEKKYEKYISRIRNIENKDFSKSLMGKLISIGKETK